MDEAVYGRECHSFVPDHSMMPLLLMGWFPKFGFSLGATDFLAKCFPLSA
jgi:hypothetical protein